MSDFLTNISSFLSSGAGKGLLTATELGTGGAGLIGNILTERQRSQQLGGITNAEKTLGDPTALAKEVAGATQPLNSGLVQSVENQVNSNLASEGLSEAPGIQASTLAQALAPFEQQNQSTALQLVLQRLGLPVEYATSVLGNLPQNTDLSKLFALLAMQNNSSGSSPEPGNFSDWGQAFQSVVNPSSFSNFENNFGFAGVES